MGRVELGQSLLVNAVGPPPVLAVVSLHDHRQLPRRRALEVDQPGLVLLQPRLDERGGDVAVPPPALLVDALVLDADVGVAPVATDLVGVEVDQPDSVLVDPVGDLRCGQVVVPPPALLRLAAVADQQEGEAARAVDRVGLQVDDPAAKRLHLRLHAGLAEAEPPGPAALVGALVPDQRRGEAQRALALNLDVDDPLAVLLAKRVQLALGAAVPPVPAGDRGAVALRILNRSQGAGRQQGGCADRHSKYHFRPGHHSPSPRSLQSNLDPVAARRKSPQRTYEPGAVGRACCGRGIIRR